MDREEAIAILNHKVSTCLHGTEWGEALDMAIKSLEQQPCEDAVSREAVKEILAKYHLGESRIAEELNELPSVQRTSNANKKHVENTLEDAISRADAIKALEYDLSIEADGGLDKYRTVIKDLLTAIYNTQKKAIENLPSVSTEKAGEWIHTDECDEEWQYRCSVCNMPSRSNNHHYCSQCGADMFVRMREDGEKDG